MQARGKYTIDDIWPGLETGLTHLLVNLTEGFSMDSYMNLYTQVYNHCTTQRPQARGATGGASFAGEQLYYRLRNFLQKHMKGLLQTASTKIDDSLMSYYKKEWDRYTTALGVIHKIFQYLNRHWIKREMEEGGKEVYEVYTLSLVIWKRSFFDFIKPRLTSATLSVIEKERNGEQVDTSLVKGVIDAYVSLGMVSDKIEDYMKVYNEDFSKPFLKASEAYYTQESNTFISKNTISDYMKKVLKRIEEEKQKLHTIIHPSSEGELMARIDRVLIENHRDSIWQEFHTLLVNDKLEDITRMYLLLSRITNGLDPLREILEKHIQAAGDAAIHENANRAMLDPRLYVETILKVHQKYSGVVANAFKSDSGFVEAMDKACRRFINDNAVTKLAKSSTKSPELVAKYCDILLKKSPKNPDEQEVLNIINGIMLVFKYIEDKDVFQTFYSKVLAKRLINGNSASEFLEGQMITKLKQNCGFEYTAKLARMFSDMALSKELQDNFRQEPTGKSLGLEFSVLVLATGSWPLTPPNTTFNLPRELTNCRHAFQGFYTGHYQGRKLNWLTHVSKGEVRTTYSPQQQYSFQCSTYQMGILLLFNEADSLNTEEIQSLTALTKPVLLTTLATLQKTKVLNADTGENITASTRFTINTGFKSKKTRVLINVRVREAMSQGDKETHQVIEEDRRLQIQAAIVRIMKARKALSHANLMTEVLTQLQSRFRPKVAVIKKCIDILIEKEYLKRSEKQKDMYSYVA